MLAPNPYAENPAQERGLYPHDKKEADPSVDRVSEEAPSDDAQDGVRNVEAITITWTKQSLILAYAL